LAETEGAKGNNENLLIMGATNSPWHVDAAFRRPGRFDKVLFVPPPDRDARLEILKLQCEGKPIADNLDFAKIAARTQHFSGADLGALCETATEFALRETLKTGKMRQISTADFNDALKTIKSTTQEWLQTARNYALYANQTGLYDPIAEYLSRKND
jgi:SpoVK/Ycf46/Vps4 family AAA+-type ATPase